MNACRTKSDAIIYDPFEASLHFNGASHDTTAIDEN
jgi:hypothetical protein